MRMRERTRNGLNHMGRHLDRPEQSPAIETSWQPPDWTIDGECLDLGHDPEWWFQPSNSADTRKAIQVCAQCPVLALCRAFAVDNRISDGTWGGLPETELRRIHRDLDALAKAEGVLARSAQRGYDIGKVTRREPRA